MFDSPTGAKPRPPSGMRDESEAAVDDRKPVVVGWAEQNWFKVERERSEWTLRRFCGVNRWGWRVSEAAGVYPGEPPVSEANSGRAGQRRVEWAEGAGAAT